MASIFPLNSGNEGIEPALNLTEEAKEERGALLSVAYECIFGGEVSEQLAEVPEGVVLDSSEEGSTTFERAGMALLIQLPTVLVFFARHLSQGESYSKALTGAISEGVDPVEVVEACSKD
jgi:hypothetical protein